MVSKSINQLIKQNLFFNDFISYLKELEKKPIELTTTGSGNIKRKEIERLGGIFKNDIYENRRDRKGEIMFRTITEDEFPYIQWIRQITEVMCLIYKRKGEIKLSKNGKAFLEKLEENYQFEQMVWHYLFRADWRYINYADDQLVVKMQKYQFDIWSQLLNNYHQENMWLDAAHFCLAVENMLLPAKKQRSSVEMFEIQDHRRFIITKAVIKMLKTFDLAEVIEVENNYWDKDIEAFRLTELGAYILEKAGKSSVL